MWRKFSVQYTLVFKVTWAVRHPVTASSSLTALTWATNCQKERARYSITPSFPFVLSLKMSSHFSSVAKDQTWCWDIFETANERTKLLTRKAGFTLATLHECSTYFLLNHLPENTYSDIGCSCLCIFVQNRTCQIIDKKRMVIKLSQVRAKCNVFVRMFLS